MDSQAARYFEDYIAGDVHDVGTVCLNQAEMVDFARKYDPQDFHIDPEKAAAGPYSGLIASGWQTAAAVMRPLVDHYLDSASSLGSPGIDELRWLAAVRPGDLLSIKARVVEARRSSSKPDRGILRTEVKVFNQDGVLVMTLKAVNMVTCRNP